MANLVASLPLDWDTWDLVLDASGNWTLWTDLNASTAQDVACAERTWVGDCWYNTLLGLLDYTTIFGQNPPLSYLTAKLTAQALTMPNTQTFAVAFLGLDATRTLKGTLLVTPKNSSTPLVVTL